MEEENMQQQEPNPEAKEPKAKAKKTRRRGKACAFSYDENSMSVAEQALAKLTPTPQQSKPTIKSFLSSENIYSLIEKKLNEGVSWRDITATINASLSCELSESTVSNTFRIIRKGKEGNGGN